MARGWTKFGLLLWKNWILQKRQVIQTLVEILVPIILATVLVVMRKYLAPPTVHSEAMTYKAFPMEIPQLPEPEPWPYDRSWTIAWTPNSSAELRYIMEETGAKMRMKVRGFESERELTSYLISPMQAKIMNTTLAGVFFRNGDEELIGSVLPKNLTIRLRFPGESRVTAATIGGFMNHASDTPSKHLSWWTQLLFQFIQTPGPRYKEKEFFFGGGSPGYAIEGFLSLQQAISTSIIEARANISEEDMPELKLQRFPYPAFTDDAIIQALQLFLPLIVMLSFVYTCISTVKVVTTEKELQIKEAMKIMGLPNWLHWTAWFIKCFGFLTVTVSLIVFLLKMSWYPDREGGADSAVFRHSDPSVVLVFMLFYAASVITFSFKVSVHFSKANVAATVAGLVWFLNFGPYTLVQIKYNEMSLAGKLATCLIGHNTAMAMGFMLILIHEGTGVGAQWHNIWIPASPEDDLHLGHMLIMLTIHIFIDIIMTIYVEAVFPGDFGVPLPWYFPFTKKYWCGSKDYEYSQKDIVPMQKMSCEIHEPEPTHLQAGVQIRQLNRCYGKKRAVNNLNLNMYEGQITVVLGHNGAGKTTTMSMLTGMITPTSGTALISGYDVRTEILKVRESLGLCPQHNILFDELTVREHLYFFGKLKGMDGDELEEEIKKYIKQIDLIPKQHKAASTLSGGMKRKLSACVALCGKSKVVMFDEPTSGMDPTARRALWDLLQAEKKGRTMLLTTHFMDEADLLGDRIAIMAGGELQCVGSSFYLKKKYGEGYRLVIVKGSNCDVTATTELLRKFIPELKVSQNIGTELSYLLRDDLSPIFEQMFKNLEDHKDGLGILSYGVSLTTMEEVFMKAGADKDADTGYAGAELAAKTRLYADEILTKFVDPSYTASTTALDMDISGTGIPLLTGFALSMNQLFAMFMKKIIYSKRTWGLFILQVTLCCTLTIMTFITAIVFRLFDDPPPRTITLDSYGEYYTPVSIDTNVTSSLELYEQYKRTYAKGLIELPFGANYTEYILNQSVMDLPLVTQHFIVGATFDDVSGYPTVNAWFNNQPFHSPPLTMNMVYNVILKHALGDEYGINIVNHPLPFADTSKLTSLIEGDNIGFQVAFNVAFGMAFLSAFYVLFAVRERVSKAKLLQFVSGVEVLTFWGSALVWDLFTFILPALSIIAVMLSFQENHFCSLDDLSEYFFIMLLFAWAMMPLMYLTSFLFTIPTTGYTRITMANIVLGCSMFMLVTLLELPGMNMKAKAVIMDKILIYVPHYNLAMSVRKLYTVKTYSALCNTLLPHCETQHSPCCRESSKCGPLGCYAWVDNAFTFEGPGINRNLLVFIAEGFGLIFVLLVVEFKVFGKLQELIMRPCRRLRASSAADKPEGVEDFDVAKERFKIRDAQLCRADSYTLLLRDVTKYYGTFLAVDQLCVGVRRGECFGLLGVNGAGKTSTFKMLTGDEDISSGDAFVNDLSLRTNMKQVHQLIGYCPQFDALIDDLTGRETLTMFCLLRGIPLSETRFIIEQLASDLLLTKHIDKKIKEYSGGNKRKLSTAVALVGDPPVVYLDEPTTGMDPMAKRHLWNVICKVRDSGKVIVLTSHSMEECEALCTRAAIMVNGQFKCLGSTQHLKNKFAEGYSLTVKVKRPPGEHVDFGAIDLEPIKAYVLNAFPGSVLKEEHQGLMMFSIKNPTLTWARMFGMMERAKQEMNIEDYSLGQTSLEQVFLTFTRNQREEFAPVVALE